MPPWLALLLVCAGIGPVSALAAAPDGAPAGQARPDASQRLMALDPADLPRAEPGRWEDWQAEHLPDEPIREVFAQAATAYARGELVLTLEHLHALLREEPDYPAALYQAGVCYFRLRRYGDAALLFERYVEAVPRRVGDTRALAHCYYTLGQHAKARDHYERVIEAQAARGQAEDVEALFGYALSHLRLFEVERALELLLRARQLDPTHVEASIWVAQILYDQGDVEEALLASDDALRLAPYSPRVWFVRARALFELGREEEAQATRERFELLDRVDQEVRTLQARLDLDPRQRAVHARLVELHSTTGNIEALRAVFGRWMALEPRGLAVRMRALDVLESLGDQAGAEVAAAELERVALLAEDAEAWRRLASWYARNRQRLKQIEAEDRVRLLTR